MAKKKPAQNAAKAKARRRRRTLRWIIRLGAIALGLWIIGFAVFVSSLSSAWSLPEKADAIVVLTGGRQRLTGAVELLERGKADRLLISGANTITTKDDIRTFLGADDDLFACCVDIGYAALDTIGNAKETAQWVRSNQFSSLIVVTANYHMPRALLEIRKTLDGVEIYPYAIESDRILVNRWLLEPKTTLFLAREYNKYLASAVRLGLTSKLD